VKKLAALVDVEKYIRRETKVQNEMLFNENETFKVPQLSPLSPFPSYG